MGMIYIFNNMTLKQAPQPPRHSIQPPRHCDDGAILL